MNKQRALGSTFKILIPAFGLILLSIAACAPKKSAYQAAQSVTQYAKDVTTAAEDLGKKTGEAVGILKKEQEDYVRLAYQPEASPTPLAVSYTLAEEREIGRALAAELFVRFRPYKNQAITKYLNLIAASVCAFSDRPDLPCCVAILRTERIAAYGLPGGYVLITLGALRTCQSESEVAGLLSNGLAHITLQHPLARLERLHQQQNPNDAVRSILALPSKQFNDLIQAEVENLIEAGFRASDLRAADSLGTDWLIRVGYEPGGLKAFLARANVRLRENKAQRVLSNFKDFQVREKDIALRLTALQAPETGRTLTNRFRVQCRSKLPAPVSGG